MAVRRKSLKFVCDRCGLEFRVSASLVASRYKKNPPRFCSFECRYPGRTLNRSAGQRLHSGDRDIFGATITFVNRMTGETRSRAETGLVPTEAIDYLIARMETWPGEWRVRSISTPGTIYRDIQGVRVEATAKVRAGRPGLPEYAMLGAARNHLFEAAP